MIMELFLFNYSLYLYHIWRATSFLIHSSLHLAFAYTLTWARRSLSCMRTSHAEGLWRGRAIIHKITNAKLWGGEICLEGGEDGRQDSNKLNSKCSHVHVCLMSLPVRHLRVYYIRVYNTYMCIHLHVMCLCCIYVCVFKYVNPIWGLGIYSKELKTGFQMKTHTWPFIAVHCPLEQEGVRKQPACPSPNKWMNRCGISM